MPAYSLLAFQSLTDRRILRQDLHNVLPRRCGTGCDRTALALGEACAAVSVEAGPRDLDAADAGTHGDVQEEDVMV